jgi:hypothetical protein
MRTSTAAGLALAIAAGIGAQDLPRGVIRDHRAGAPFGRPGFVPTRIPPLPPDEELRRRVVSPEIRAAIDSLDAPSWDERERATRTLLDARLELEDLYAALAEPGISPERRHRLLGVTVERIVNSPRGALGVRMDLGRDDGLGVRITATIPGMPAAAHLEPDDLIVAIDGRAVHDREDLIRTVQGKAPGDPVKVEALRPGRDDRGKFLVGPDGGPVTRRIEVTFPLGSTRDLERSSDQGNTLFSDPISAERIELAQLVRTRWGPRSDRLRLPADRDAAVRLAEGDVELHPEIAALRRYREAIDAGLFVYDAAAAATLEATQRRLAGLGDDPSLDPEERAWYAKVARRYLELIPPRE